LTELQGKYTGLKRPRRKIMKRYVTQEELERIKAEEVRRRPTPRQMAAVLVTWMMDQLRFMSIEEMRRYAGWQLKHATYVRIREHLQRFDRSAPVRSMRRTAISYRKKRAEGTSPEKLAQIRRARAICKSKRVLDGDA
jgi:hypothetical protein